jgi:prepilin-type N-terminal cleavage/methylation domain-containing protein
MTILTRRTRGFTLIELMVVLAIASLVAIYTARRTTETAENQVAEATADNVKMLGDALASYMANNTTTLAGVPNTTLTIAALQAAGTCGAGRPCLGSFGSVGWTGGYDIRVVRIGSSAPYAFEGLACTINAYTVMGQLRGDLAGKAVAAGGGRLGMTYDTTGGAVGFGAGWTAAVASYPFTNVAGKVCYFVPQPSAGDIYLRRDGGNTMLGTLNMNANAIAGATNVTATGALTAATGAFSGAVNASTLGAAGAVTGGSMAATGAITAGTNITASGIVQGTNVTATGTVTGGTVTSTGNINIAGGGALQSTGRIHIQAGENLYLQPFANGFGSPTIVGGGGGSGNFNVGTDLTVGGNAQVNNTLTATNDINISTLTSRANAPSTTSLKALAATLIEINSIPLNTDGQSIAVPTCPNGGSARIFAIPQTVRGAVNSGNWGADIHIAGAAGGPWNFYAKDANGASLPSVPAPNFIALARIFCAY